MFVGVWDVMRNTTYGPTGSDEFAQVVWEELIEEMQDGGDFKFLLNHLAQIDGKCHIIYSPNAEETKHSMRLVEHQIR